jgi:hypothetical protein
MCARVTNFWVTALSLSNDSRDFREGDISRQRAVSLNSKVAFLLHPLRRCFAVSTPWTVDENDACRVQCSPQYKRMEPLKSGQYVTHITGRCPLPTWAPSRQLCLSCRLWRCWTPGGAQSAVSFLQYLFIYLSRSSVWISQCLKARAVWVPR